MIPHQKNTRKPEIGYLWFWSILQRQPEHRFYDASLTRVTGTQQAARRAARGAALFPAAWSGLDLAASKCMVRNHPKERLWPWDHTPGVHSALQKIQGQTKSSEVKQPCLIINKIYEKHLLTTCFNSLYYSTMYTASQREETPANGHSPGCFVSLVHDKQERNRSVTYYPTKDSVVIGSSWQCRRIPFRAVSSFPNWPGSTCNGSHTGTEVKARGKGPGISPSHACHKQSHLLSVMGKRKCLGQHIGKDSCHWETT